MGSKTSIVQSCNRLNRRGAPEGAPTTAWVQYIGSFGIGAAPQRSTKPERPLAQVRVGTLGFVIYVLVGIKESDPPEWFQSPSAVSREFPRFGWCDNDPSAGSPTETLLRLHLPLNDKVRTSSHSLAPMKEPNHNPESSPDHSIGRCDGRCVQRAGT